MVVSRRRRDRHGRGLRRAMPANLPAARTRAEAFDDLVLDAVEHLELRWRAELTTVEFAVEDVPPADLEPGATIDEEIDEAIPLARTQPPSRHGTPARIILHRRPIEARARSREELSDLVLDIVIHEVARLLDSTPERIDPEGHGL